MLAENKEETLRIACRACVLATGSWICNEKISRKVCPGFQLKALEMTPHTNPAYTGDGIPIAEHAGAFVDYDSFCMDIPRCSFQALAEQLAYRMPGSYAFLYKNSINLLIGTDEVCVDARSMMAPIMDLLEQHCMAVGISNPFASLTRLREYSYQAFKALQLGSILHRENTLNDYRDYAIYRMVEAGLTQGEPADFCLPELQILQDHCRDNGAELMNTLRTYLACKCNKAQTAKVLFTHPNTIKYRVSQIENIMGISLDDEDNILQLQLSFKLLDYRSHFSVGPNE